MDKLARFREALNEKTRQLRFETGSVRNLLKTARLPLPCRPEFIDVRRRFNAVAAQCLRLGPEATGRLPEFAKGKQLFREGTLQPGLIAGLDRKVEFHVFFQQHR
ncbi:MAG TPA: hypothetical protein VEL06_16565 [Haliangiales bacterium]|nr:hypothetical protein [Haliangiales bacterium]